jgi:MFS family permease
MLVGGAALFLLGLFTLAESKNYYQIFLSQGLCVGLGAGLLYVPCLTLVTRSFKDKRALALSIVTCGVGLGMSRDLKTGHIHRAIFQGKKLMHIPLQEA